MGPSTRGRRTTRRIISILASVGLVAGMLAATGGTAAAAAGGVRSLTCSGGDFNTFSPEMIKSGTYSSITVTGFCEVASGAKLVVTSGLTVAPGGFLVASGALDNFDPATGSSTPDCNRKMTVSGGVQVGAFGSLYLGDGFGSGCPTNTKTTINGGLTASGALELIVHGVIINGDVTSLNGGDGQPCNWNFPIYSTIEDSHVNGNITVDSYHACWLGFARNHVTAGSVTLTNNVLDDPDAMEILSNTINGGLACSNNSPVPTNVADGVSFEPNTVRGAETGQCAGL
jgi:hypothetical protein